MVICKISTLFLTLYLCMTLFRPPFCYGRSNLVPVIQIPTTNLSTGVFYTISMKVRPLGVLSWTDQHTTSGGNYLQLDLTPGRRNKQYKPGGPWYVTSQWIFHPLKHISTQFLLRNRYDPSRLVTSQFEEESGYNFVTLDGKDDHGIESKSSLVPVGARDTDGSEYRIQLQFARYPRRYLTMAPLMYGEHSHYLQVAPVGAGGEYGVGGTRWNDTLFKFSPVTDGVILSFGSVSAKEFKLAGTSSTAFGGGDIGGEIVTVYQEVFRNPGPFPTINVVKTLLPDTSGGLLTFNNPALIPYIQLGDNFTISLTYNGALSGGTRNQSSKVIYTLTPTPTTTKSQTKDVNSIKPKNYVVKPLNRLLPLPPRVIKNVAVNETLEFSVRQELYRNVELPFSLRIPVSGDGDRVLGDDGGGVARGQMPPDVVLATVKAKFGWGIYHGKDTAGIEGDQVFLTVAGIIKGTFLFGVETIPPIV